MSDRHPAPSLLVAFVLALLLPWGAALAQNGSVETGDASEPVAAPSTGPVEWAAGIRPTPGLWLVIDDGRGARLVVARQTNAVGPLLQAASEHGMSLRLPEGGGTDDRQGMAAAWEADARATRAIAGRYGTGELVVGRLERSGGGWQADWRVVDTLGESEGFTASGADALALLGQIGDRSARHLAFRSGQIAASGPAGEFDVVVENIGSADDYIRLRGYLEGLPLVRGVRPVDADGSTLRLRLDLSAGTEAFDRLIESGNVLSLAGGGVGAPRYRMR